MNQDTTSSVAFTKEQWNGLQDERNIENGALLIWR